MTASRVAPALAVLSIFLAGCGGGGDSASTPSATPTSASQHAPETVAAMNRAAGIMGKFDFEDAAKAFDAIAADPAAPPEARLNRAIATLNQSRDGAQDAALVELKAFLAADPPADLALRAKYCMGLCELYLGRAALAEPLFAEAADARANDPYAQYFAAQALEQQGEYAKALARYIVHVATRLGHDPNVQRRAMARFVKNLNRCTRRPKCHAE